MKIFEVFHWYEYETESGWTDTEREVLARFSTLDAAKAYVNKYQINKDMDGIVPTEIHDMGFDIEFGRLGIIDVEVYENLDEAAPADDIITNPYGIDIKALRERD